MVTVRQLRELGVGADAVLERHRTGRLHRLYRGIYAVGHTAPSNERRWMAAVLAIGDQATLSHRSAAELLGLLPVARGPVDVSLPGRCGREGRRGLRIHRPVSLATTEVTRRRGIPVTVPARCIADLRGAVPGTELRRAIRQAEVLGMPTGQEVSPDRTRSELERRFLWLCRRHRLPEPEVNMRIGRLTVDFCWVEQRLVAETDGYRYHRGRAAFEDDRDRDLQLRARGFEVLRLSHRQVFTEAERIAAVLRRALGRINRDMPV